MVPLESALKSLKDLPNDCTEITWVADYEKCGEGTGFQSKLLPGVKIPHPDFPSLTRLGVNTFYFKDVKDWNMIYKKFLIKIP